MHRGGLHPLSFSCSATPFGGCLPLGWAAGLSPLHLRAGSFAAQVGQPLHRLRLSLQLHLLLSFLRPHEGRHRCLGAGNDCPMPVPQLSPQDRPGLSPTSLSFSVPTKLTSPLGEACALHRGQWGAALGQGLFLAFVFPPRGQPLPEALHLAGELIFQRLTLRCQCRGRCVSLCFLWCPGLNTVSLPSALGCL